MQTTSKTHPAKLTAGIERTPQRAMLRAIGLTDEDFDKPIIGIANTWVEAQPCNYNLKELAEHVKKGVRDAGGTPLEFNTIAINDAMAMGHEGMKASLISREVICDSIELATVGYQFDAIVTIGGCDKTQPASAMAMARLNVPSVYLYGGSIPPGDYNGKEVTIQDVFEAMGQVSRGTMTVQQLRDLECNACPTFGACGGMFTANTMASALEAIGITVPNSAAPVAPSETRKKIAYESGWAVMKALESNTRPRDILTKEAFENAIMVVAGMGGSTNAVLHLLAIAHEAGVKLTLEDIDRIGKKVPELADLRPAGKYVMSDVDRVGGVKLVIKQLLDAGFLHPDARTVTGETLADRVKGVKLPAGQDVIHPISNPVRKSGGFAILRGNLAVEGGVLKTAGATRNTHRGPAKVFNREEDARKAIMDKKIKPGDVVVVRYEGPERRAGNARDARGHVGHRRAGAEGLGRPPHGREVLRRDSRVHDRPRRSRGDGRRGDRTPQGRRHHRNRRREEIPQRRAIEGRACQEAEGLEAHPSQIHPRGLRKVRPARDVLFDGGSLPRRRRQDNVSLKATSEGSGKATHAERT